MKPGDLVKVNTKHAKVPGALTAVKFFARLEREVGGSVGIVISISAENAIVQFPSCRKVIHNRFLHVVSESR